MSYLVTYMSVETGWVTAVVQGNDADDARALAIGTYGPPSAQSTPRCVQLDGQPMVYRWGRSVREASARVVAA